MFFVSTGTSSRSPLCLDWLMHMVCVTRAIVCKAELAIDLALPVILQARRTIASELLDRVKTWMPGQQALIARLQREWSLLRTWASGLPADDWAQLREMRDGGWRSVRTAWITDAGEDDPAAMREELWRRKAIERESARRQ